MSGYKNNKSSLDTISVKVDHANETTEIHCTDKVAWQNWKTSEMFEGRAKVDGRTT
jgi:hypothetical protein